MMLRTGITALILTLSFSSAVMAENILFHRGRDATDARSYIDRMTPLSGIPADHFSVTDDFRVIYSGPKTFDQMHAAYPWVERIDDKNPAAPSFIFMTVSPEVATRVIVSNGQTNRIAAPPNKTVKDVVFSPDKGLSVKIMGRNVFVSFDVLSDPSTGEHLYRTGEAEAYVVTDDNAVYPLILVPRDTQARTVYLTCPADRIKQTTARFDGMPLERQVLTLVKAVLSDEIDDTFSRKPENRMVACFEDIDVFLKQCIGVPGQGLVAKEFILTLKDGVSKQLTEKMFLAPTLATRPVSITLSADTLEKDRPVRLIVVERKNEDL